MSLAIEAGMSLVNTVAQTEDAFEALGKVVDAPQELKNMVSAVLECESPEELNTIGKRLKQGRKHAGLTQDQAAKELNVSRTVLSKYENDRTAEVPGEVLKAAADLYVLTVDWFVEGIPQAVATSETTSREMVVDTIGERIQFARELEGLSLDQAARITGLSEGQLVKYENNQVEPSYSRVRLLCQKYNMSMQWMLGETTTCDIWRDPLSDDDLYKGVDNILRAEPFVSSVYLMFDTMDLASLSKAGRITGYEEAGDKAFVEALSAARKECGCDLDIIELIPFLPGVELAQRKRNIREVLEDPDLSDEDKAALREIIYNQPSIRNDAYARGLVLSGASTEEVIVATNCQAVVLHPNEDDDVVMKEPVILTNCPAPDGMRVGLVYSVDLNSIAVEVLKPTENDREFKPFYGEDFFDACERDPIEVLSDLRTLSVVQFLEKYPPYLLTDGTISALLKEKKSNEEALAC